MKGLPKEFIEGRKDENGDIKITLKYPDIIPIASNCEISETRKKVVIARGTAYENNLDLMKKGTFLRKEIANLLGKSKNHQKSIKKHQS